MERLYDVVNFGILVFTLSKVFFIFHNSKHKNDEDELSYLKIVIALCSINIVLCITGIISGIVLENIIIPFIIIGVLNIMELILLLIQLYLLKKIKNLEAIIDEIEKTIDEEE